MNKVVIKIDHNYSVKSYRYGFDNSESRWSGKPYEFTVENWDAAPKNVVKDKNHVFCSLFRDRV